MPNGVLNNSQAEIVGSELTKLEKRNGCIKPADVVDEARPESAPLHPHFTWDDTAAAELFRQDEARAIIRSVRIIRTDMPIQEQECVRAVVHVNATDTETKFEGAGYIGINRAIRNIDYRQQLLTTAKAEIISWQRRYADLLKFSGANEALETLVGGLKG